VIAGRCRMIKDQLSEIKEEFYGSYDEETNGYLEDGVYEDNNELADWARVVVPELFEIIENLLKERERGEKNESNGVYVVDR
jgi:hypothetical protein